MKKNTFLSGLRAKLALAAVAVAAMFTSCSNEDIEIGYKAVNATFEIQPTVVYDGQDVTSSATITYSDGSNGKYSGTTISAGSVDVTASYNGQSATKTVSIPSLAAAQSQFKTVLFILSSGTTTPSNPETPSNPDTPEYTYSYDFDVVSAGEPVVTELAEEAYTYDNVSDYWINHTFTYNVVQESKVANVEVYGDTDKAAIEELAKAKFEVEAIKTAKEVVAEVGAHSRLIATPVQESTTTIYNVVETATTKAGDVVVVAKVTVTTTETTLEATGDNQIPGHSHAPQGHGHGHGDDTNAGGGIVYGE
jgi:hypothetical protein